MMLPGKLIISTPMLAALALLCFFGLAEVVYAQVLPVPGGTEHQTSVEDLFRYGGWTLIVVSLLGIAAAAIYNALRKAAFTEVKELAEVRKGKLMEKELEIQEKDRRIRDLERENEDLEKKNFRLQERGNV
jgi:hypothetical protein